MYQATRPLGRSALSMRHLYRGQFAKVFFFLAFLDALSRFLIKQLRNSGGPAFVGEILHDDGLLVSALTQDQGVPYFNFTAGFGAIAVDADFAAFDGFVGE